MGSGRMTLFKPGDVVDVAYEDETTPATIISTANNKAQSQ